MSDNGKQTAADDSDQWLRCSPETDPEDSTGDQSQGEKQQASQQGSQGNVKGTERADRPASAQSKKQVGASRTSVRFEGGTRPGSGQSKRGIETPGGAGKKTAKGSRTSVGEEANEEGSTVKENPLEDKQRDSNEKDNKEEKIKKDLVSESVPSTSPSGTKLVLEPWAMQKTDHWPKSGKHILAQYTDEYVVVYQAFRKAIADSAVKDQKFGGGGYSFDRMSWIKTNFLWMMYRSGWATKQNQERILAVKISKDGWDEILSKAYTVQKQREANIDTRDIEVRLQWDPDHNPTGGSVQRRAIQLGLKKDILRRYGTEFIQEIEDITEFVKAQHNDHITHGSQIKLLTPRERVYKVDDESVAQKIEVDRWPPQDEEENSDSEI